MAVSKHFRLIKCVPCANYSELAYCSNCSRLTNWFAVILYCADRTYHTMSNYCYTTAAFYTYKYVCTSCRTTCTTNDVLRTATARKI